MSLEETGNEVEGSQQYLSAEEYEEKQQDEQLQESQLLNNNQDQGSTIQASQYGVYEVNYQGSRYKRLAENHKGYENLIVNINEREIPIIVVTQPQRILTCESILCRCARPQFNKCQNVLGLMNIVIPGSGLQMCCLYGCGRPDCSDVFFAGCIQLIFAPLGGWFSACIVGAKMMKKE